MLLISSLLSQTGPFIIFSETDTSQEEGSIWDSEDKSFLGLERSNLSDYLRDKAEYDAVDAAFFAAQNPTTIFLILSSNLDIRVLYLLNVMRGLCCKLLNTDVGVLLTVSTLVSSLLSG
jgi:hypothetical protein